MVVVGALFPELQRLMLVCVIADEEWQNFVWVLIILQNIVQLSTGVCEPDKTWNHGN
jgi:hypothetical protein